MIEIEISNGRIKNVILPDNTKVHIFDYDCKKYSENMLEPDEKDVPCRQQIWFRGKKAVTELKVVVRKNKIFEIIKPPECEVVIKIYEKNKEEVVQTWKSTAN